MTRPLLPLVGADPSRPSAVSLVGRYALGVTWQDGHASIYPFAVLHASCGCGEPMAEAWPSEIRREAAALRVVWQDGHGSAVPYAELRRRCVCAQCGTARTGAAP